MKSKFPGKRLISSLMSDLCCYYMQYSHSEPADHCVSYHEDSVAATILSVCEMLKVMFYSS